MVSAGDHCWYIILPLHLPTGLIKQHNVTINSVKPVQLLHEMLKPRIITPAVCCAVLTWGWTNASIDVFILLGRAPRMTKVLVPDL